MVNAQPQCFFMDVKDFLDETFPSRWIGRGGPIDWPPHSPCINPMDLLFYGYFKDVVYVTPVSDMYELKTRIRGAISTFIEKMLFNTWAEIEFRLDTPQATYGSHVVVH